MSTLRQRGAAGGLIVPCVAAAVLMSGAAPAAAGTFTVVGGTVKSSLGTALTCTKRADYSPCPVGMYTRLSVSQTTTTEFEVVREVVTEPSFTSVPLQLVSASHNYQREEASVPADPSQPSCSISTTSSDSSIQIDGVDQSGGPFSALFEEFGSEPISPALKLVHVGEREAHVVQPTTTRTSVESNDCASDPRSYSEQVTVASLLAYARAGYGLENGGLNKEHATRSAQRCREEANCDVQYSGVLRLEGRPVTTWGDGSGEYRFSEVIEWTIRARRGGTKSDPDRERPEIVDRYCSVGSPMGEFGAGFAGLIQETGWKPLGPLGVGLGVVGAACNAHNLWDTPVDSPESAIATGACAGLTTFSLGVGAGSLFAAGTFVGLPAAFAGGVVSLGSGLLATIPCAYENFGGAASRRARAAQAVEQFREIPDSQPVAIRLPQAPRGTPRAVKGKLRALTTNVGRVLGAGRAFGLCQDRAAAAAAAEDQEWRRIQQSCAADNADRVARGFRRELVLHRRLAHALRKTGVRTGTISPQRARRSLTSLPRPVKRQLRRIGASRSDVVQLQGVVRRRARGMHVPRTLGQALTGSKGRAGFLKAAGAFEALAGKLRDAAAGGT